MAKISDVLGFDFVATSELAQSAEIQLQAAIGEDAPSLIFDGLIHRFGDKKSRWYVAFDGDIPAAAFGDWKSGLITTWRADIGRNLTMLEEMVHKQKMTEAKTKRDAEFAVKYEAAIENAEQIMLDSTFASPSHEYLIKKQIQPHGARITNDGRLVIPVYSDGYNKLTSVQYISSDGTKMFLKGGIMKGGWWHIGELIGATDVFIAEGYATAASIHEATGLPCAISFSAGELSNTAVAVRALVGNLCSITICADNDESKAGELEGKKAASLISAKLVISPVSSDFNDAACQGLDIKSLLILHNKQWLLPLSSFCQQPSPIKYLIKKWIPRKSLVMVHGASGSGKTFVVIDWMCSIASTLDNWSNQTVKNGHIVYLAGEGHNGLKGRFEAWSRKNFNGETGNIDLSVSQEGCNLNTPIGYQLARDAIISSGKRPVCIVVDTLHRFLMGDENSAQDAKTMLDACAGLMEEFDCTVLLVHHTGVNDDAQHRARGSSAWKGALDVEISVVNKNDGQIELIQRKNKDAELAETQYLALERFQLEGWIDEDGMIFSSAIIVKSEKSFESESKKGITPAQKRIEKILIEYGAIVSDEPFLSEIIWQNTMPKDEKGRIPANLRTQRSKDKKELIDSALLFEQDNGYIYPNDAIRLILNKKFA